MSADATHNWRAIEQFMLAQTEMKIAVWFAVDGPQVADLYARLVSGSEQTTLVVDAAEPKEIKKTELVNIQGLLTGLSSSSSANDGDEADGDVTKIPTIAITSSWDAVSSVPGLAYGANADASGVVALFHVARTLSKLYANARTQARYNVVFLLSSGAGLNFAGTRHWIDSSATGSAVRDSLEWVICLDALARAGGELYLHVSRPSKDPLAARLYDTFAQVATRHNIPFQVVQKKINIAESTAGWEHEIFARRKVLAATLSTFDSSDARAAASLLDKHYDVNALSKNTLVLVEALTRLIYVQDEKAPAIVTSLPNATLTQGWMDTLTSQPRMVPFIDAKHPVTDHIETTLKQFAPDVSRQHFKADSDRAFFDSITANLTSYTTKPFTFDLAMLAIALAGNALLYILVKGDVSAGLADILSLLSWFKGRFTSSSSNSKAKKQ